MEKHRNLLFVFPDEFRPYSMGFLGRERVITPTLDAFSKEAVTLTNAISSFPVCSPYRAMLFSGKYPYRNGVIGNCRSANGAIGLPEDIVTLSDRLAAAGYSAGYIGKWHLQAPRPGDERYGEGPRRDGVVWDTYTPPGAGRHGFDFWYSYGCCDNHNHPHYWTGDDPIDRPVRVNEWSTIHETDVAIDYLRNTNGQRDPGKPFALFVAPNPPHMPFAQVPQQYRQLYADRMPEELATWENLTETGMDKIHHDIQNYFAMISGVDDQFGRLLTALDETGLADDTVVIFTSDHGDMMGSHGLVRKSHWYNESLLVPFLIRHPDATGPGRRDDALLPTVDLFPSILGLLGLPEAIPEGLDGRDYSERILNGTGPSRQEALYMQILPTECHNGKRGIKTERYTYAIEKTDGQVDHYCIDNLQDEHQLHNVFGDDPERDRDLMRRLHELLVQAKDPFADWMSTQIR